MSIPDHLRNHGFMLEGRGWHLAPAYDMNPDPWGEGLRLNISDSDNAQELDLAMEVAPYFRVKVARALEITEQVIGVVRDWRQEATRLGLSPSAQDRMARAFRMAEEGSS